LLNVTLNVARISPLTFPLIVTFREVVARSAPSEIGNRKHQRIINPQKGEIEMIRNYIRTYESTIVLALIIISLYGMAAAIGLAISGRL
jgi:hypothetical protein